MSELLLHWSGDIHRAASPPVVGLIVTLAAIACGALIGLEREHARKPAGLRTTILICLGSAIFAQASILIGGTGDHARIAAQVVTGIGFLGAGAIMHERGTIIGITTGAGIWATSAVGVTIGGGYVLAGVVFAALIAGTLAAAPIFERMVWGRCRMEIIELTFDGADGKTQLEIDALVDEYLPVGRAIYRKDDSGRDVAEIRCCESHRHHRGILPNLAGLKRVIRIQRRSTTV